MAIQGGTTMFQKDNTQNLSKSVKIPNYTAHVIARTERAEEQFLDDWLKRLTEEENKTK